MLGQVVVASLATSFGVVVWLWAVVAPDWVLAAVEQTAVVPGCLRCKVWGSHAPEKKASRGQESSLWG